MHRLGIESLTEELHLRLIKIVIGGSIHYLSRVVPSVYVVLVYHHCSKNWRNASKSSTDPSVWRWSRASPRTAKNHQIPPNSEEAVMLAQKRKSSVANNNRVVSAVQTRTSVAITVPDRHMGNDEEFLRQLRQDSRPQLRSTNFRWLRMAWVPLRVTNAIRQFLLLKFSPLRGYSPITQWLSLQT